MKPEIVNANVRAWCSDCNGALTTFEIFYGGKELGSVIIDGGHEFNGKHYSRVIYTLMKCAGCGRGTRRSWPRGKGLRPRLWNREENGVRKWPWSMALNKDMMRCETVA